MAAWCLIPARCFTFEFEITGQNISFKQFTNLNQVPHDFHKLLISFCIFHSSLICCQQWRQQFCNGIWFFRTLVWEGLSYHCMGKTKDFRQLLWKEKELQRMLCKNSWLFWKDLPLLLRKELWLFSKDWWLWKDMQRLLLQQKPTVNGQEHACQQHWQHQEGPVKTENGWKPLL